MQGELVFWFIDEREDRIEHLKRELQTVSVPGNFKVKPEYGRFHEEVGSILSGFGETGGSLAPTFAFIDPFGFSEIPFKVIKSLLAHKGCEAFITFMVDAINRFLRHPEDDIVKHIVDAFGTDEAVQIAKDSGNRIENLRTLYQRQLNTVARYVRYFEMRDHNNRVQYYLFFASNNRTGHVKMKDAMWKVDPEGEFRFSDATNPNQMVLFEADTTSPLINLLWNKFGGRKQVLAKEVLAYVEDDTAYLKKHMTAALRQGELDGRLKVEAKKSDGARRKAGTYPDLARMSFDQAK